MRLREGQCLATTVNEKMMATAADAIATTASGSRRWNARNASIAGKIPINTIPVVLARSRRDAHRIRPF